jgi:hypothetical protein
MGDRRKRKKRNENGANMGPPQKRWKSSTSMHKVLQKQGCCKRLRHFPFKNITDGGGGGSGAE